METEKIEEMPNFSFRVIDNKTGKEADVYNIALKEDWAKGLIYCDMEGFAIEEEGNLILLDECGNVAYCPSGRFTVIPEGAVVLTREEYAELNITGKMYNEAIEQARKETAIKIKNKFRELLSQYCEKMSRGFAFKILDETCKQFGVEIEG